MQKPFSESCERNQQPIFEVLKHYIDSQERLFEIASGTGQHAVFLAKKFPNLTWTCSDVAAKHLGIRMWIKESKLHNIEGPLRFQVGVDSFPHQHRYPLVFTANSFHILPWKKVKTLIKTLGKYLQSQALVFVYGPMNYGGAYSSPSNEAFDRWLKEQHPEQGIRNAEDVDRSFAKAGFALVEDHVMPANNRMLVYRKQPRPT
ncbi:MAG: DUF938 domain-containing protein [Bdellovibrionota bacterium]